VRAVRDRGAGRARFGGSWRRRNFEERCRPGVPNAAGARLGIAIDDLEDELADLFERCADLVARKAVHPLLRPQVEEQARIV
jgi:hypothetical protein